MTGDNYTALVRVGCADNLCLWTLGEQSGAPEQCGGLRESGLSSSRHRDPQSHSFSHTAPADLRHTAGKSHNG